MRKTVNPGSRLELEGSFDVGISLADLERLPDNVRGRTRRDRKSVV